MDRRTFVGGAVAGVGMLGVRAKASEPSGDIPTRVFGKTGVKVTMVGQAGARLALCRTKEVARLQVQHALARGVTFFDCARSYWGGHSEEVYGDVLPPHRKEIFLTTKSTQRTREGAEKELAQSLAAMKTDYLDLWQVHAVQDQADVDKVFAPGGAMEAFEAAKKAGKCRFIGFTGHHDPAAHLAMLKAYDKWDSILMPLHAADPAYMSFQEQVLPVAVERGMAIQAMKVFGNAFLLRVLSVEECLRYSLSLPIHVANLGCSSPGQLDDDIRIAQNFKPYSPQEMQEVAKLAVTAGPGGLQGAALEYWKVGGVWK
jgi:uncharacterized protein